MYKQKLSDLLERNGIDETVFHQKLYWTLLLGVFEVICKEMKKQNTKAIEKERFRKRSDRIVATKKIVKQYVGCTLSDEEYSELAVLLTAHFRAGEPRKKYENPYREKLLMQQNGRCATCKAQVTVKDAHLDHIIPWDYVGDNLEGNYQMLCETCNERKGKATCFEISMLLLNKSV